MIQNAKPSAVLSFENVIILITSIQFNQTFRQQRHVLEAKFMNQIDHLFWECKQYVKTGEMLILHNICYSIIHKISWNVFVIKLVGCYHNDNN